MTKKESLYCLDPKVFSPLCELGGKYPLAYGAALLPIQSLGKGIEKKKLGARSNKKLKVSFCNWIEALCL